MIQDHTKQKLHYYLIIWISFYLLYVSQWGTGLSYSFLPTLPLPEVLSSLPSSPSPLQIITLYLALLLSEAPLQHLMK